MLPGKQILHQTAKLLLLTHLHPPDQANFRHQVAFLQQAVEVFAGLCLLYKNDHKLYKKELAVKLSDISCAS